VELCVLFLGCVLGFVLVVAVVTSSTEATQFRIGIIGFLLVFVSLCEKKRFNPLTTLLENQVAFCFYNVSLRLLSCETSEFPHKHYMTLC
jgi:galactitol-specific phosphotransferase system IIC component